MSRYFLGNATPANSSYLEKDVSFSITSWPVTYSAWYYPLAYSEGVILRIANASAMNAQLGMLRTLVTGQGRWTTGNSTSITTSNLGNLNAWNHLVATGQSGSQYVLLNGDTANAGTGTGVDGTMTNSRITVGLRHYSTTYDLPMGTANGTYLAELAVWNVILSANEMQALYRGVNPWKIRPANIRFYLPLFGYASPEPEFTYGGNSMTLKNSPTQGPTHAPVTPYYRMSDINPYFQFPTNSNEFFHFF